MSGDSGGGVTAACARVAACVRAPSTPAGSRALNLPRPPRAPSLCSCGYVFCSSHRHAQDHACAFDYQGMDRERLAKANPLVAAAKINKL